MGGAKLLDNHASQVSKSRKMKIYLYTSIPIFANTTWLCCLDPNSTSLGYPIFIELRMRLSVLNMSVLSHLGKRLESPTFRTHFE